MIMVVFDFLFCLCSCVLEMDKEYVKQSNTSVSGKYLYK